MDPHFLVIGKNGQVGWELCRTLAPLGKITSIDFPDIDLTNPDSIRQCVREMGPSVIVNAAAYTAVDKAESEADRCQQINGVAPGILSEEGRRLGALIVHYSTDYVFDGLLPDGGAYTEEDAPNPLSVYGRAKLAGDQAVQALNPKHLIFRLCWVYGARGQNFMLTMMRLAREREKLRVVNDQFGSPTWCRLVAETTSLALKQALAAPDPTALAGVYHMAASGYTTWHQFARAIVDQMPTAGKKCTVVEPITTPEYPLPAQRPARSILSCNKLKRTFGLQLPTWEAGLQSVLETI